MESFVSIITPAFNEEGNLPILYKRLCDILDPAGVHFEWLVIDDCSEDNTFFIAESFADKDSRVRVFKFSRNFGSHAAIRCGLEHCKGDKAVVLAADMQDPPEIILQLIKEVAGDVEIVWAVRVGREGETRITKFFSRFFYWIMNRIVGIKNQPPTGADFFCITRKVINAVSEYRERNTNILALLCWLGFQQGQVQYVKQARAHGKSGWDFKKKIKLVVDSVTSFSFLPVRALSFFGICAAFSGFLYAIVIICRSVFWGSVVEGWASLMVAVLLLGGGILVALGVLGEYLWRNLDEARSRPLYVLDKTVDTDARQ